VLILQRVKKFLKNVIFGVRYMRVLSGKGAIDLRFAICELLIWYWLRYEKRVNFGGGPIRELRFREMAGGEVFFRGGWYFA